jgi:pimeloyl-ACP methyl ester carboxylesterase
VNLTENTCKIKSKTYQYYELGQGEISVILLHGIATSKHTMLDVAEELSKSHHCVLLDIPGHNGLSLEGFSSLDDLAEYILEFIEHQNIKKYVILGYSLGGLVALKIAEIKREKNGFMGLIIWSSPVIGFENGLRKVIKAGVPVIKQIPDDLFVSIVKSEVINRLINRVLEAAGTHGKVELEPISKFRIENASKLIDMASNSCLTTDNDIPKLFLFDKYDPIISLQNYYYVKEALKGPKVRVRLIDRSGHFKNRYGLEKMKRETAAFIKELSADLINAEYSTNSGAEGGI